MRTRTPTAAVLALVAAAAVSGCSSVAGTPTAQDWTDSPVFSALRSIPADADSTFEIGLVDARALNALDAAADDPLPTTAPQSGQRPPAEYAWTKYSIAGSGCAAVDSQYSQYMMTGFRTGPPGDLLTVYRGGSDLDAMLAVCQGDADPSALREATAGPEIAGVAGVTIGDLWLGERGGLTYQFGGDVPSGLRTAVLSGDGGGTEPTLADDPAVLAVLDANPRAAAVEMGTVFVGLSGFGGGDDQMRTLLADAQEHTGATLPEPTFGGYGWTQDHGLNGTGAFVTYYASADNAAAAGTVLSAIWQRADDTPFAAATTTVDGAAVVTRLPGITPTEFDMRNLNLAKYPGYGTERR